MEKKKETQGVKKMIKKTGKSNEKKKVEISFYAPEASKVYVAGDFNNWDIKSLPMKKNKQGTWKKSIKLPLGSYEYKIVVDGMWVQDISSDGIVLNPFGTHNSIISVK